MIIMGAWCAVLDFSSTFSSRSLTFSYHYTDDVGKCTHLMMAMGEVIIRRAHVTTVFYVVIIRLYGVRRSAASRWWCRTAPEPQHLRVYSFIAVQYRPFPRMDSMHMYILYVRSCAHMRLCIWWLNTTRGRNIIWKAKLYVLTTPKEFEVCAC